MTEEKLSTDDYIKILEKCVAAWNRGDAEAVASFYTDNLDYRDPTVPDGITRKEDFINYLKLIFKAWPEQEWIGKMVMPHEKRGEFSVSYNFRFASGNKVIQGSGIDRIEFRGDRIYLNHIYLNADRWREWIKSI